MTDNNFDCNVDLTLSVLQILYITMHIIELQDIINARLLVVNYCCNAKLIT